MRGVVVVTEDEDDDDDDDDGRDGRLRPVARGEGVARRRRLPGIVRAWGQTFIECRM